jgi:hypothetical protein
MICPSCKTLNFRDTKFCRECGEKLAVPAPPPNLDATRLSLGNPEELQVQALLNQAFTEFDGGRTIDARLACQAALALRPDSTAAHSLLGLIYEKEGKTAEAIHQFRIVLELNPNSHADREKLERLLNQPSEKRPAIPWLPQVPVPLAAGGAAAVLVLGAGLWITSAVLRPGRPAAPRVRPTYLRMSRGAPGAVSPSAGSLRLPPPPLALRAGTSAWGAFSARPMGVPGSPVGGVPTTVRMNARMSSLPPSLFSNGSVPPRRPVSPPRPRYLAPAPVRLAPGMGSSLAATPRAAPSDSVPQLPDARPAAPAPEMTYAPPQAPAAAATPPVSPPADPPSGTGNDSGGDSYIRIRPLGSGDAGTARSDASHAGGAAPSTAAPPAGAPAGSGTDGERPAGSGPSLGEARLHQQNGFNFWRQGDYAAAYQEYEYAEQLYRLIAARRGPEAAAALQGMRAAQQGMQASRGR